MRTIRVSGSWARVEPLDITHFETCLRVRHPSCFFNRAYKERRWDGYVKFYRRDGAFPAGLVERVVDFYTERGETVTVVEAKVDPPDLARFTDRYLPGITLRPDQMSAIRAMLTHKRGVVKSGTGTGKGEFAVAVARYLWEEFDWRTLIVVPKLGLLDQQIERCRRYYGTDLKVGKMGEGQKYMGDVVVATAATLQQWQPSEKKTKNGRVFVPADPLVMEVVKTFEVFILDETHHASSDSWYEFCMASSAKVRLGMSGSPLKPDDLGGVRMTAATGPLIYEGNVLDRIAAGDAAKPKIVVVASENVSGPPLPKLEQQYLDEDGRTKTKKALLPYSQAYQKGYVENELHNRNGVVRATSWLVDHNRRTLVLCRKKAHWSTLHDLLTSVGVEHMSVWGDTDIPTRNKAKKLLSDGKVPCVLASTIWDEGEDVPGIDAMVFAEGVAADTNAIQRTGRGMRRKGGANEVWIVDFVPTCHPRLRDHAIRRAEIWEGEGYEVLPLYDWPAPDAEFDEHQLLPFLRWDEALAALAAE
jgi:superfamily II DNA or RNA helicase